MKDNYILIERILYDNAKGLKKVKLSSTGELKEQNICKSIEKEHERNFKFKNKTIIGYQGNNSYFKDKYDSLGRLVKMKYFENDILVNYLDLKYKSPFSKTECDQIIIYKPPRKIECIWNYKFNEDGKKMQELCYFPNGNLAWYNDFFYNLDGQISEVLTYNNENILIYRIISYFNDNGLEIKIEKYLLKSLVDRWLSNNEEIGFYLWTSI
jgi:hypothetical protein